MTFIWEDPLLLRVYYSHTHTCRLMDQIVTRQEVWKYRKVFDGYERDWLKVPFKKLDISLISEKVAPQSFCHNIGNLLA